MRWPQKKRLASRKERKKILKKAHYNVFYLPSQAVYIDLLTDSGTGRMSNKQWESLEKGDESYAGSTSSIKLKRTIKNLFGVPYVLLVHQGRAAENVFGNVMQRGEEVVIAGNTPFDTTRLHIESRGGTIIDCTAQTPIPPLKKFGEHPDFLGNIDLKKFADTLKAYSKKKNRIAYVLITATCNSNDGQPVSLGNIRKTSKIAHKYKVPVFLDLARYAENAFFIKQREKEFFAMTVKNIIAEMVKPTDGFLASGKKDALGNMGGFMGLKSKELATQLTREIIMMEGLDLVDASGYGGMSGHDMEALNQGIIESTDEKYLRNRISQVNKLGEKLFEIGIPVLPPGGHAIFVDAGKFLPHLLWNEFPGHALSLALYLEGGIRSAEIGSLMLGRNPETGRNRNAPQELTRLAVPRRLYKNADMNHVVKTFANLKKKAANISPVRIDAKNELEPRHFAAHFLWDGIV